MGKSSSGPSVPHLVYLDGLRGLLALYVLASHFFWPIPNDIAIIRGLASLFRFGHEAVGFFIVLSGYSLMLPVALSPDRTLRGGFGGYLYRRARRILPPYYGALWISIAIKAIALRVGPTAVGSINPDELSWSSIVSHGLLIHTWVRGQAHQINQALWSVATEWHIYFLFPTILLPIWRRAGTPALILAAFALGAAPLLLLPMGHHLLVGCPWYVGLFALGMGCAVVTTSPRRSPLRHLLPLLSILGFAAILHRLPTLLHFPIEGGRFFYGLWMRDVAVGLAASCLLLSCARDEGPISATGRRHLLVRLLESRPAVALGTFSYSIYATHCAIVDVVACLIGRLRLSTVGELAFRLGIGVPVALAFAYVFSLGFEVPFLRSRPRPAVPAALGARVDGKAA